MQSGLSAHDIERIHWMTLALRLPEGGVMAKFQDSDSCVGHFETVRWQFGLYCPRCKARDIAPKSSRKTYRCRKCAYHFSATAGTFAHGANRNLLTYFLAAEDIIKQKARMSSFESITGHEFKDQHGLAYMTARRLLKLLTEELLLEDGGLIGRCICAKEINVPPDIELGGHDHFHWLFEALQARGIR
ncbi:transposase-like zinc ribbon protein [Pacificibacter maritimus]|uniref:Transposase-like zinc ribbon protein n=2 Tax=Pacificibacter maritimus TaxID=762213 RepID=A0A3N4UJ97_9RHOB|nr:transposase-like zinc ribbon protein [Pacificibacter maritimus]